MHKIEETLPVTRWGSSDSSKTLTLTDLEFTDNDRIYMTVNGLFDVRIVRTDEGIVIDVFSNLEEGDPIATTYAYDIEAKPVDF